MHMSAINASPVSGSQSSISKERLLDGKKTPEHKSDTLTPVMAKALMIGKVILGICQPFV